MAESTIPVDLFNPGQVFACLGFMALADVLLGVAEAGFDWSDPKRAFFRLTASSDTEPVKAVLEYLAHANATRLTPFDYIEQAAGNAAPDDLSDAIDDDSGSEADRNRADQNSQRSPWIPFQHQPQIRCPYRYGCRLREGPPSI